MSAPIVGGGGSTAHTTRARRRGRAGELAYLPALDGVRAFAVLGVMLYHFGSGAMPAGFLGVDAFFVLSGYLITSLLVAEHRRTGGIRLPAFWARRARRLLPALFLLITVVALYVRFVLPSGTYPGLRGDALSALFYFSNWHFIAAGTSYFAQGHPFSPLLHTWSLAIEEQFYVVWPLVVLAVTRFCRTLWPLLWICLIGAIGSAIEMAVLYNPSNPTRVYFGTDTHAQSLLVGSGLAVAVVLWRAAVPTGASRRARRLLGRLAVVAVVACGWTWSQGSYGDSALFRGGFLAVDLGVAAVVACGALAPQAWVTRLLSFAPLRSIGKISYGMYLWHFPIRIALDGATTGLLGAPLLVVRIAVTIAISALSYVLVEQPIRQRRILRARPRWLAFPVASATVATLVVLTTAVPLAAAAPPLRGSAVLQDLPSVPAAYRDAPVRALILGDSVALTLGSLAFSQSAYHLAIVDEGIIGCGVVQVTTYWGVDQTGQYAEHSGVGPCSPDPAASNCDFFRAVPRIPCLPWTVAWRRWLAEVKPNVVVLLAGRWETMDELFRGQRTNITDPAYAAYVKQQLGLAVRLGTSTGARMILATTPCFDPGELPNGAPLADGSPQRVAIFNHLLAEVAGQHPNQVVVQDLHALVCPEGAFVSRINGVPIRDSDGVHFAWPIRGEGADYLAPEILPFWEAIGHEQEVAAKGTTIAPGAPPPVRSLSPA